MLLEHGNLPRERKARIKGAVVPIPSAATGPIASAAAGAVSGSTASTTTSVEKTKENPAPAILAPYLVDDYKPDYARSGHLLRPQVIDVLAAIFFPFAKPSLQRVLTYTGHRIAKAVLVIVAALEKTPKLLHVILNKSSGDVDTGKLYRAQIVGAYGESFYRSVNVFASSSLLPFLRDSF